MATIINNGGNIINKSTNSTITVQHVNSGDIDYASLTNDLEKLLAIYQDQMQEDKHGIENLEQAVTYSKTKDKSKLNKALMFFSKYMLDFAQKLSLSYLTDYIKTL